MFLSSAAPPPFFEIIPESMIDSEVALPAGVRLYAPPVERLAAQFKNDVFRKPEQLNYPL